jgi:hypothetical protein
MSGRRARCARIEIWQADNPETFFGWLRKVDCGDAGPSSLLPKYFSLRPHCPGGQPKSLFGLSRIRWASLFDVESWK